jgi:DNA helicase HerA-like ATPase
VPAFLADVKGDLTGIAQPGKLPDKVAAIVKERACRPRCRWPARDAVGRFRRAGHPVRATVSDMGPLPLGRMLARNETQAGVLNLVF